MSFYITIIGLQGQDMAIKIDLHKAYDSINWDFISSMLHALNFPA